MGGTFTDAYVTSGSRAVATKVPTIRFDLTRSLVASLRSAAEALDLDVGAFLRRVAILKVATTIGTNAVIEGTARKVTIGDPLSGDGMELVLCRVQGKLYALDTRCPHEDGGRLVAGPLAQGELAVCPLHNYRFDPKSGKPVQALCRKAKRYRVVETGGDAELWV